MSQHDMDLANQAGAAFRADANNALLALVSNSSGTTEPSVKFAYQWWADTTTGLLKIRNAANSAWITFGSLASLGFSVINAPGDLIYGTAADTAGILSIGTAGQQLRVNAGATAPEWATPMLSKSFTSSAQTITGAGSLTLAHSLGAIPTLLQCRLKCVTGELGYSTNDEILIDTTGASPQTNTGVMVLPDATNVNIRFGSATSCFNVVGKTTGISTGITHVNWNFIVRAWV